MATLTRYPAFAPANERIDDLLFRICQSLQLSLTQYDQAKQSYGAICNWLDADDSELQRYRPTLYPQGSVALGTTVKPQTHDEYDVDLVCEMQIDASLLNDPISLLNMVERRLRAHSTYAPLIERKNRCIRVNYERQFHLDILPACPDGERGGTSLLIPDRKLEDLTKTNPKGFIAWFKVQSLKRRSWAFDEIAKASAAPLPDPQAAQQKQVLQLAVQLLKRWRDIHYTGAPDLAPVSIVLTTLAGSHYIGEQSILEALCGTVSRTIASLPSHGRLMVCNPANEEEDLSDRWNDPTVYQAFVYGMHTLREGLQELRDAQNVVDATSIIKRLFGEAVTKAAYSEQMAEIKPARATETLGVSRIGVLGAVSAVASTPVRANTFYGD